MFFVSKKVYIHGGFFNSGSSTAKLYDPSIFVSESQAIFVTLNYRVNIFGFLYLDNENAPGNQGISDQKLALNWVKVNIKYFGGNEEAITLFGQDAGAFSAQSHAYNYDNGYKNYIMHSGSLLSNWAILDSFKSHSRNTEILEGIGCSGNEDQQIECAKKMDAKILVEKSNEYFYSKASHGVMNFPFLPVSTQDLRPTSILAGSYKDVPKMYGFTKENGNFNFAKYLKQYQNLLKAPELDHETFKGLLKEIFYYYPTYPTKSSQATIDSIIDKYTNVQDIDNSTINNMILDDATSDFNFICPLQNFFKKFQVTMDDDDDRPVTRIFIFYFTHRSSASEFPDWLGVMHGDELPFIFGHPFSLQSKYTSSEKELSRKMIKYWSNFAKSSHPVPIRNEIPKDKTASLRQSIQDWENGAFDFNYLDLSAKKIQSKSNFRKKFCNFWSQNKKE